MIESLLLVSSICIDAFVASMAYGSNKIKIPIISSIVISIVGSIILGISLFVGGLIKDFLPGTLPIALSFSILMILGIYRLFESLFKTYIQKHLNKKNPLPLDYLTLILYYKFMLMKQRLTLINQKNYQLKNPFISPLPFHLIA